MAQWPTGLAGLWLSWAVATDANRLRLGHFAQVIRLGRGFFQRTYDLGKDDRSVCAREQTEIVGLIQSTAVVPVVRHNSAVAHDFRHVFQIVAAVGLVIWIFRSPILTSDDRNALADELGHKLVELRNNGVLLTPRVDVLVARAPVGLGLDGEGVRIIKMDTQDESVFDRCP